MGARDLQGTTVTMRAWKHGGDTRVVAMQQWSCAHNSQDTALIVEWEMATKYCFNSSMVQSQTIANYPAILEAINNYGMQFSLHVISKKIHVQNGTGWQVHVMSRMRRYLYFKESINMTIIDKRTG